MKDNTFIPDLKLAIFLPPQERFRSKFGGFPWGLPQKLWPKCPSCECLESFVAQLGHSAEALPLGDEGQVLNLFWCLSPQCMAVPDEIKNVCFLLEADQVSSGLTKSLSSTVTLTEAVVLAWIEKPDKDEIEISLDFKEFDELTEQERKSLTSYSGTKAGGSPHVWPHANVVNDSWKFVLQMEDRHSFAGPMPSADLLNCSINQWASAKQEMHMREENPGHPTTAMQGFGDSWYCDFFPSPGWPLAYVYMEERDGNLPACYMISR